MKRTLLIILAALLCGLSLHAQNITNVKAYQSDKNIIITYHLDKKTNIKVQVSTDYGKTYSKPLEKVSGDIGDAVLPGNNSIVWDVLSEVGDYDGKTMAFKVSVIPSKARFQQEFVVQSGWFGATSSGIYTSVRPLSLEYLLGVRRNHVFFGVGADLNRDNFVIKADNDETKLDKNKFSVDLNACLKIYFLKESVRVNPYLSANLIYGFLGNASYAKENESYDVQGKIKTGGLMWAASVGASIRIAKKSACILTMGVRSFNLNYDYMATGTPPYTTTQKVSQSMLLIPMASIGFAF